ncbi:MAG: sulfur carrier protein ThiS [Acidiferrobacter sp.]
MNGKEQALPEPMVLGALLGEMGLTGKRVAVEINREIIPRGRHAEQVLRDGDHIEIVQAIGGG